MIRPFITAALLIAFAGPVLAQQRPEHAQDELSVPVQPAPTLAPDAMALAHEAAARGDQPEALSRYLRILSAAPDNVAALVGAGKAALAVGDMNAAAGFLARADALDPKNGEVKAGLATTMLQRGDPRATLRLFKEAVDLGVMPAAIAADRGLAYDLRGDQKRAQADYMLVLRSGPNDEITRRLAISQAIGGVRVAAMATLDPLLRKQDVPAWRARAFVFALTGDAVEAQAGAALVMPSDQAAALAPYLTRLATLKSAEKAAAIHLGRFPGEGEAAPAPRQAAAAAPPRIAIDRAMIGPAQAPAEQQAPAPVVRAEPPLTAPEPAAPVLTPAQRAAEARAKRAAAANAAKEKQKRQQEAEEKAAAKRNPARHWVQVAGGANRRDLGKEWSKLKAKWPGALAGRSPWTTHYRYTNRLLIGPFATADAAQDWVSDRKKEGFATFRVATANGEVVERVN
jgi:Flp pilus assembly protein TadD